jgi:hypothetical protein
MSFKRLIPLALLATVMASGTAFAERWTGYVDHHNVPVRKQVEARNQHPSASAQAQTEYLPEGWPRTY